MLNKEYSERLQSEKDYHNERAVEESRIDQEKYYVAVSKARERFSESISRNSVGKDVLEIGCFQGGGAEEILKTAKSYVGIDISDVAIEKATQLNSEKGLRNFSFLVRDACETGFPDASFDTVVACGIIHHLPIEKSLKEIQRILKPGGKAILFEPLGENPLINLYRKHTPDARTPDETPLLKSDIANINKIFPGAKIHFFGLTTLLSVPLRHRKALYPIFYKLFYMIDKLIFLTPLRWWAWMIVVEGERG